MPVSNICIKAALRCLQPPVTRHKPLHYKHLRLSDCAAGLSNSSSSMVAHSYPVEKVPGFEQVSGHCVVWGWVHHTHAWQQTHAGQVRHAHAKPPIKAASTTVAAAGQSGLCGRHHLGWQCCCSQSLGAAMVWCQVTAEGAWLQPASTHTPCHTHSFLYPAGLSVPVCPILLLLLLLQVSFEPESLPSVSVSGDSPTSWAGDLLAVAVTTDDINTTGGAVKKGGGECVCNRCVPGCLKVLCCRVGGLSGQQMIRGKVVGAVGLDRQLITRRGRGL